jgi:hypothetical protein
VRRLALVATLLACLWVGGATAAPAPVTESAQSGQVRAELTYLFDEATDDFEQRYTQLHLRIQRADAVLIDTDVKALCSECTVWPASGGDPASTSVAVTDLDRDGEPEVLLDLYTGGAHCCVYTTFFRYGNATAGYSRRAHSWGNPSYRLRDFGGDGRPEFVTADDRFNYAFSCFACSAAPILVQRYTAARLVNVTRSFRAQVVADANRIWAFYRRAVQKHVTPSGLLPAYLADEYLAGRGAYGLARVRNAVARPGWQSLVEPQWRNRTRYVAAVLRFLHKTGYR